MLKGFEDKTQYLRKVINKRPVVILLPGPSIAELERRITELKDCDICYASVNDFWIMEEKILRQIGKLCSLIVCSAKECNVPNDAHIRYLRRAEDNVFISEAPAFHPSPIMNLEQFIRWYDKRLLFFVADRTRQALERPNDDYPLHFLAQASCSILVCLATIGKAPLIVLFGADGGKVGNQLYYGGWDSHSESRVNLDTVIFNQTMPTILRNTCRTYNLTLPRIINCSLESKYEPFERLSYEDTFGILRG